MGNYNIHGGEVGPWNGEFDRFGRYVGMINQNTWHGMDPYAPPPPPPPPPSPGLTLQTKISASSFYIHPTRRLSSIAAYHGNTDERERELREFNKIREEYPSWVPKNDKHFPILFWEMQEAIRSYQDTVVYAGDPSLKSAANQKFSMSPRALKSSLAILALFIGSSYTAIKIKENYGASDTPKDSTFVAPNSTEASTQDKLAIRPLQPLSPLRPQTVRHHHGYDNKKAQLDH